MNMIFQDDILLNNDNIVVSADGADPSRSVNSGHNGAVERGPSRISAATISAS